MRIRLLIALALLGTVFFARLWMISSWASDVPFYDQWQAEGLQALVPWKLGTLSPGDILASHNEHRVALTRLTALALTALGGVWDPRVQMVFNASPFLRHRRDCLVVASGTFHRRREVDLRHARTCRRCGSAALVAEHDQRIPLPAVLSHRALALRHQSHPEAPRALTRLVARRYCVLPWISSAWGPASPRQQRSSSRVLAFEKPLRGVFRSHGVTLAACA
jgi:hypothetical protein